MWDLLGQSLVSWYMLFAGPLEVAEYPEYASKCKGNTLVARV